MAKVTVFRVVDADQRLQKGHWMSVEDATEVLQCSDETIRRLIRNGDLEARKQQAHGPSRWRWIIPTDDLERVRRLRRAQGLLTPVDLD